MRNKLYLILYHSITGEKVVFEVFNFSASYVYPMTLSAFTKQEKNVCFEINKGFIMYDGVTYSDYTVTPHLHETVNITVLDPEKMNK